MPLLPRAVGSRPPAFKKTPNFWSQTWSRSRTSASSRGRTHSPSDLRGRTSADDAGHSILALKKIGRSAVRPRPWPHSLSPGYRSADQRKRGRRFFLFARVRLRPVLLTGEQANDPHNCRRWRGRASTTVDLLFFAAGQPPAMPIAFLRQAHDGGNHAPVVQHRPGERLIALTFGTPAHAAAEPAGSGWVRIPSLRTIIRPV